MKLIYWTPLMFFAVAVGIIALDGGSAGDKYNLFAQCLSTKGFKMYGADWCSHCQNEKRAFGDSFKYVEYIECPDNIEECRAEGINGYPTWELPDGRKLEGEQGLEKLSQESGCLLPANK